MSIQAYTRLLRPKHYFKNFLIFLPLVFSGYLLDPQYFLKSVWAFCAFSLAASAVYVINDVKDKDLDALHPKKKYRPIAAGKVSVAEAWILTILLLGVSLAIQVLAGFSLATMGLLGFYILINLLYSFGLKNIPIIDVAILSLGFVLRVFYGGDAIGVVVSKWLYLAILAFSFYLSLGKRRNEIRTTGRETRKVNKFYNQEFLDKNMYVFLGLTVIYYSLWAIDPSQPHHLMFWTVPVVIIIIMAYSLAVEEPGSDGDPVSVLFSNKPLLALIAFYCFLMAGLIYL